MNKLKQLLCWHKYSSAKMNVINTSKTNGPNPVTIGYLIMGYVITCDKCGKTEYPNDTDLPVTMPTD